jgi:hypothetical protein
VALLVDIMHSLALKFERQTRPAWHFDLKILEFMFSQREKTLRVLNYAKS